MSHHSVLPFWTFLERISILQSIEESPKWIFLLLFISQFFSAKNSIVFDFGV